MSHYELELSKKEGGWILKKMNKEYRYNRVSDSPVHATIEDAKAWIRDNHAPEITPWIDHKINGHIGHLMTLEDWKEQCEYGMFIDDDGYGDLVTEDFEIVGRQVSPSQSQRDYSDVAKYILWYNR